VLTPHGHRPLLPYSLLLSSSLLPAACCLSSPPPACLLPAADEVAVVEDEALPHSPGVSGWGRGGGLRRDISGFVEYGNPAFWELHYHKEPEAFDWFQDYGALKDVIVTYAKTSDNILHAGCGTSMLPELMYDDGYLLMTNIDVSHHLIDCMREKYRDRHTLEWLQMNVCALEFPEESIDFVLSKGLLDAMFCGENWAGRISKALLEVSRVLKPGGTFLIISNGIPDKMMEPLQGDGAYKWTINHVHSVVKPIIDLCTVPVTDGPMACHYIYVIEKDAEAAGNRPPPKLNVNKQTKIERKS